MVFFRKRRKNEVIDLGERYQKRRERINELRGSLGSKEGEPSEKKFAYQGQGTDAFSFLSSMAGATQTNSESDYDGEGDERRRKLAKRLMDMTKKLEDISNQIYHLQQRLEVVERKLDVSRF